MFSPEKTGRPRLPQLSLSFSAENGNSQNISTEQEAAKFTYSSFPSPVLGRSPTLPSFRIPKYGYYNIEGDRSPMSSPFEFAQSNRRNNSVLHALIQSINYFVGIGVLTLPYALRMTGWFGLVLLVVFGLIMTATAWLFGRSRKKIYLETFSDHIEFAFATKGRVAISFVFYTSMLINAGVFTKLLGDTLSSLTGLSTSTTLLLTAVVFAVVANVCTTTTAPLTHVMSLLGTVSTAVLLAALVTAETLALLRYQSSLPSAESAYIQMSAVQGLHGVWSYTATERVYITDLIACLKTLAIFGYCYMGHEVFPAIFHNMRHPHCFTFVVSIAFSCMMLCYAVIATLGYLAYGVHSAGNIVDNFPPEDAITWCVKVCLAVTVLAKLTQCAAPLCEGLLEWIRLAVYIASHTKYLAGLVRQPARPMPRLRLDSSSHTLVPSQSTYGTYPSEQGTHRVHPSHRAPASSHPALDLSQPQDRRKYFNMSYFDVEVSSRLGGLHADAVDELTALLPSGRARLPSLEVQIPGTTPLGQIRPPDRSRTVSGNAPKLSLSLSRSNSLQRGASWGTSGSTPRRGLTWSDTLPIPPIRSPSCENLLASSTGSAHLPGHMHAHGATCAGSADQAHSHALSTFSTLLGGALSSTSSQKLPLVDVHIAASPQSKPSSSSSAETDDLFYDDADPPPTRQRQRLYSDFSDLLQANKSQLTSSTAPHSAARPGRDDKEEHRCAAWADVFLTHVLPVLVRCALPLLALAIASLFRSFVGMIIFTGGVCGALVSIVIPTWAYLNIHHLELSTAEKSLLWAIISTGLIIATATIIVAAL